MSAGRTAAGRAPVPPPWTRPDPLLQWAQRARRAPGGARMSDTPESAPKRATYEPAPDTDQVAPATAPAESAAAEPHDTDPQLAEPPSDPVSARGHINRSAEEEAAANAEAQAAPAAVPAAAVPAAAAPQRPSAIAEPEPVVATDDDVAA